MKTPFSGEHMKNWLGRFLHLAEMAAATVVLSVALSGQNAWSQAVRTIKIIVPFTAGGVNDVLARLLAEQVGRTQNMTMVVENRAGAGSLIGTEVVSRAPPT